MTDRTVMLALFGAVVVGLAYRLAPIVLGEEALARFFITEDGYLMLTVARNIGIGAGMSVSEGSIQTNGVQPLATLLFALPYWATGGDKVAGLAGVVAIMTAWSVGGFLALRAFAARALAPGPGADEPWPLMVATLWCVGPLALLHTMNGLETGLYTMMVALTVTVFGALMAKPAPYTTRDQILLGVLCGVTFLSRIDGAFLVTAIFLVRFIQVQTSGRLGFAAAVREALPPGLISLAFAAPWLAYNYWLFGSIMPISGTAQSETIELGRNLAMTAPNLFETMATMLPIPERLETWTGVRLITAAALIGIVGVFLWRTLRRDDPFRFAVLAYLLFAAMLVVYYGMVFGAGHFLSRYFAPLAPLLIVAGVTVALEAARALRIAGPAPQVAGLAAVALSLALLGRLALPGVKAQGHFQVVEWTHENVAPEIWVGAVQTGTLGYWHDRTINLDGKVNPAALRERLDNGHVLGYVVTSEIDFVIDWASVGQAWSARENDAGFNRQFELVLLDRKRNLSVMRRTAARGAEGGGSG